MTSYEQLSSPKGLINSPLTYKCISRGLSLRCLRNECSTVFASTYNKSRYEGLPFLNIYKLQ